MEKIKLFDYQQNILSQTKDKNKVAYYLDMGLGKTFIGSEKLKELESNLNLVVCQLSKVKDWIEHFKTYYPNYNIFNLRNQKDEFFNNNNNSIGVINYESAWRIKELKEFLKNKEFTLMLDESSQIKNENAKKSKFLINLNPTNVILLSGTPVSGKYEELWSQCKLLGWDIRKSEFYKDYIIEKELYNVGSWFPIKIVVGYKNVGKLKRNLRRNGAIFKKSDEVISLPEQIEQIIKVEDTKELKEFRKHKLVTVEETELVGNTVLTRMLYERQLSSQYNKNKLSALVDLIESTNDRLIIFYNFNKELEILKGICKKLKRPVSEVNGKTKDLDNYALESNSVTLIQYQAGAHGLNLQKANKVIYFSLPLSSEHMEQSKKRVHRIGQSKTCFYYYLLTEKSIDEEIYKTLQQRKDYTNKLFEGGRE